MQEGELGGGGGGLGGSGWFECMRRKGWMGLAGLNA